MKKITKILVPTDLSAVSLAATDYARLLASASGAQVYLIHIIEETCCAPKSTNWNLDTSALGCAFMLQKELEESFIAQLYRFEDIVCVIRRGDALSEILKFALEEKIDHLVMTTHGKGYLSDKPLGSIAGRLIEQTNIPVTLVRPKQIQHPINAKETLS